jgi:hypothetical protein
LYKTQSIIIERGVAVRITIQGSFNSRHTWKLQNEERREKKERQKREVGLLLGGLAE